MRVTQLWCAVAAVLLLGTSVAQAAFTNQTCLAKKRKAQGKFQQCRALEEAKALQGKPADLANCTTKFQDKIAELSAKASIDINDDGRVNFADLRMVVSQLGQSC